MIQAPERVAVAGVLSGPLPCPLCDRPLQRDDLWISPHWLCPKGHSYSNQDILIAELRERGLIPSDAREARQVMTR